MTSTPVKDVGSIMKTFAQTAGSAGKTAQTGFQQVLDNHTGKGASDNTAVQAKKNSGDKSSVQDPKRPTGKPISAEEPKKIQDSPVDEAGGSKELTEEELEKAMEVLGSAAMQLMEQIADAFGMTANELMGIMEQLDMQPMDVLNPEQLSSLLLAAGGAEDSFSLLTNAELYEDYRTIMNRLNELLQQSGESLDMDAGQLMELAAAGPENISVKEQHVISVEVTTEDGQTEEGSVSEKNGMKAAGLENTDIPEGNRMHNAASQKQTQDGEQHAGSGTGQEQSGNMLLQNLRTEGFQEQVQQLAENSHAWDADTQDIMKQIMDYMRIQIKPDASSLEMQLHPESLGTVHIQIASKGGAVTAHFVTENDAVKAALESQMVQLKESFSEQGVKVEAIEVTVQTHQFERNLDQGRGRQQEEPGKKSRTRRINLNGPLNIDEMEEEEAMAADIMTANGNTVDYTA